MKKVLFITWAPYGSRPQSLAEAIGARAVFIGKKVKHKYLLQSLLAYLPRTIANFRVVLKERPDIIMITNTQWIIAAINLFLGKMIRARVIFDSHSAAFDHPFIKYPLFLSKFFARKAYLNIVTNNFHKSLLEKNGATGFKITDIPFEDKIRTNEKRDLGNNFNICFICTFSSDEPVFNVLQAVEEMEGISLFVTGNYKLMNVRPENYQNVHFTGFIPNKDFNILINSVDAIMSLTTRENTMQRGGSEAISVEKPLITSDTKMLREYFVLGTIFIKPEKSDIKKGILTLKENYNTYLNQIITLRRKRTEAFSETIKEFNTLIS